MSDLPPFLMPSPDVSFGSGTFDKAGRKVAAARGVEWVRQGWELFKRNPGIWIAITIIMAAVSMLLMIIPFIGPLAVNFLIPVLLGGIMLGCQSLAANTGFGIDTLFAGFKQNTSNLVLTGVFYLAGSFIIGIVVSVIALIFVGGAGLVGASGTSSSSLALLALAGGGLLIAILVGLALYVPLLMAFYFAPPLVMLREVAPFDAMKASFAACLKNIVPFLVFGAVTFVPFLIFFVIVLVLPILAIILLFISMLVLAPVLMGANYASYMDIFE
jgi:uncharacterized membrane protein